MASPGSAWETDSYRSELSPRLRHSSSAPDELYNIINTWQASPSAPFAFPPPPPSVRPQLQRSATSQLHLLPAPPAPRAAIGPLGTTPLHLLPAAQPAQPAQPAAAAALAVATAAAVSAWGGESGAAVSASEGEREQPAHFDGWDFAGCESSLSPKQPQHAHAHDAPAGGGCACGKMISFFFCFF
ncbi:hypothetical protein T492DRAFT_88717 [Pavlovales sp. CCMP2436]|nr:hypothetical protein T492DRAFT_88717 [Pavlovales sp. CCMP2436]